MVKNIKRGEAMFRAVFGVVLILLAFLIHGSLRWFFGTVGVIVILTALFGY